MSFLNNQIYASHGLVSTGKVSWKFGCCPNHCSPHFLMVFESTVCLVRESTYVFVICSDHTICRIFLWHLISNTSSLASSLSIRLQHSAAPQIKKNILPWLNQSSQVSVVWEICWFEAPCLFLTRRGFYMESFHFM